MKQAKKGTTLLLAVMLSVSMLFSCQDMDGEKQTSDTDTTDTVAAEMTEQTTAPDTTETASDMETETGEATESNAETVEVVTYPSVIADNGKDALKDVAPAQKGTYIDPLTGLGVDKAEAERRPVSIMLNNITAALPQQQISAADVLYECQVEGYLTRLMGVFNDWEDLTAIGSIRSAREYYIDFAANHDAIFVHAGGSEEAYRNLKSRSIHNIDGVNGGEVTAYFYRDPVRRQTMSYEHTLVIDGTKLNEAIALKKYRTTYADTFDNPLNFVGEGQAISLTNGKSAAEITIKFGAHTTSFSYDAASNKYMRYQNGKKHIDGTNDAHLGFENVIVLFCPYTLTNDDLKHIEVDDVGSGSGYYMTGGKYVEIRWSKASGDSQVVLTHTGGREVTLTPGKTNIEIVGYSSAVTIVK